MAQRSPPEFTLEAFADPSSVRDVVRGILHTIFFHRFFPSVLPHTREVLDLTLPYVQDVELETMIDQRAAALERQLDAERTNSGHPPLSPRQPQGHHHPQQQQQPQSPQSPPQPPYPAYQQLQQQDQRERPHHSPSRGPLSSPLTGGPSGGGGGGGSTGHGNGNGGRAQLTVRFFEKRRRKGAWYNMRVMGVGVGGGGHDEEVCWERWTVHVTVAEPRTDAERAKVRRAAATTLLAAVMKIVTSVNAHKDHIPPITTSDANPFPYHISVNQKEAGGWWPSSA